jgi:hypothetical protein
MSDKELDNNHKEIVDVNKNGSFFEDFDMF